MYLRGQSCGYQFNHCLENATRLLKEVKGGHIRIGSFGFGTNAKAVHWEYGPGPTEEETVGQFFLGGNWEQFCFHTWVECDNGDIIDIMFPIYTHIARINGVPITTNDKNAEKKRCSPSDWQKLGVWYHPIQHPFIARICLKMAENLTRFNMFYMYNDRDTLEGKDNRPLKKKQKAISAEVFVTQAIFGFDVPWGKS